MASAVPPRFAGCCCPDALHPDHHQGFAVTGSPALFYYPSTIEDEFLQRIYRATFSGCCCGGFSAYDHPVSASAWSLTPPGVFK